MHIYRIGHVLLESLVHSKREFRRITERLLPKDEMTPAQSAQLVANDTSHLSLPRVHPFGRDMIGDPASRLIADFVIDVIETAGLLNDLARIGYLLLHQLPVVQ